MYPRRGGLSRWGLGTPEDLEPCSTFLISISISVVDVEVEEAIEKCFESLLVPGSRRRVTVKMADGTYGFDSWDGLGWCQVKFFRTRENDS